MGLVSYTNQNKVNFLKKDFFFNLLIEQIFIAFNVIFCGYLYLSRLPVYLLNNRFIYFHLVDWIFEKSYRRKYVLCQIAHYSTHRFTFLIAWTLYFRFSRFIWAQARYFFAGLMSVLLQEFCDLTKNQSSIQGADG